MQSVNELRPADHGAGRRYDRRRHRLFSRGSIHGRNLALIMAAANMKRWACSAGLEACHTATVGLSRNHS